MGFIGQYNVADLIGNRKVKKVAVEEFGTRNDVREDSKKPKFRKTNIYHFDENGNISECESSRTGSSKKHLEKRSYNDENSWLEHYRYYPDQNSLQKDEKRVYDSQNVLTSSVRTLYKKESKKLLYLTLWLRGNSDSYENHLDYIRSGFVNSTVHMMNDVDQIVKSISIDNEEVFSNFKYFEYNSKGLKIKMTKFNTPDEKKEETSYEYDQNDNLIK